MNKIGSGEGNKAKSKSKKCVIKGHKKVFHFTFDQIKEEKKVIKLGQRNLGQASVRKVNLFGRQELGSCTLT